MQLVVEPPLHRADIPGLCGRVCRLLTASDAPRIVCDVGAFPDADAVVVDALAQLQLAARRLGRTVELRRAGPELRALLTLMGLGDVVSFASDETP
ncbi:MAG TPA: STAS domain-containing protein [Acidimicrobiia bacterium]|jgi:ABC-type transporter Mla MlaB component